MRTVPAPDPVTLANVRQSLKDLAGASEGKSRRTVAVLGDLDAGPEELMDLGRFLVRLDLTSLVVVGDASARVHAGAVLEGSWGEESRHVATGADAVALLRPELTPEDVLLVIALPDVLLALEGPA